MLGSLETILSYRVEKEALANYFIVSLKDGGSVVNYQAEMLENNETSGILKFDSKVKNGQTELWYDISLYEELTKFAGENKISGRQFADFLEAVVNTILSSSKLFLDETHYVLDKDYIYVGKNMAPFLIYLPVQKAECDLKGDFKALFDYLSAKVEISTGVGDAIQILLKEVNSDNFNFKGFAEKLNQVKKQNLGGSPARAVSVPELKPYIPEPVKPIASEPVRPIESAAPTPASRKPAAEKPSAAVPQELQKKGGALVSDKKELLIRKTASKDPEKKKAGKAEKGKVSGSDKVVRATLLQVLAILALAALFQTGAFKSFDMTQIAGVVLIILVIDFLATRKLLGIETPSRPKKEKEQAPGNPIKKKEAPSHDIKINKQLKIQSSGAISPKPPAVDTEETVTDFDNESTVVLDAVGSAYLVNNEGGIDTRITVSSNPFIMGKSRHGVDMVCNNKHISRQHAQIIYEDAQYYLVDLESTNGTSLNGTKLEPNMKYPLSPGDTISLVKENYTFFI